MEFINPGNLPPEMVVALEQMIDRRTAFAELWDLEEERFFDELTPEQVMVLRRLIRRLDTDTTRAYLDGRLEGFLRFKFKRCVNCGGDHTENEHHVPTEDDEQAMPLDEPEKKPADMVGVNEANMIMFRLTWDEEKEELRCKDCNKQYPSIEDRMLKKPSDCPGCHEMNKWGAGRAE